MHPGWLNVAEEVIERDVILVRHAVVLDLHVADYRALPRIAVNTPRQRSVTSLTERET